MYFFKSGHHIIDFEPEMQSSVRVVRSDARADASGDVISSSLQGCEAVSCGGRPFGHKVQVYSDVGSHTVVDLHDGRSD